MAHFSDFNLSRVLFAASLALTPFTHAIAQGPTMVAKVPFDFQDGSHTFTAGKYLIRCTGENTIEVQDLTKDKVAFVMTQGEWFGEPAEGGKLVFHKYGDQYFLSEIRLANRTLGRKLLMSRAEKQLRGTSTKRPATGSQIALNVKQP